MLFLKQSTTVTVQVGPYLDDTDGKTAETGLTVAVELSKNGAAFAARNSATATAHDAEGYYRVELNTTDTNTLGCLQLKSLETGALPIWHEYMVMPAQVWDSLFGADVLQAHVVEFTAGVIDAAAIASGAIDADALASNAITAAKVATDAIDEIVDAVWDEARSGHTTSGTFGQGAASVQGNVTGSVASVTGTVGSVTAAVTVGTLGAGVIDAASIASNAIAATKLASDAVDEIVDAVWDEARAGHTTNGTFGQGVASVQGNVTGSVGSVTGAVGSVTAGVNVASGGIAAAAFAAGAVDAAALAADAVTEIADGVLKRDFSAVTGEAARSMLNALRWLRNKWSVSGTTLTVTKEDDATTAWTSTVTTDAAAEPVTGSDPA
jgi:hypothetical protein